MALTVNVPGVWAFVLLALSAYRVWRLIGEDDLTEPLRRRWVTGHEWRETFVACPWCAGFWITLAWWGAWQVWPHGSLVAAVPFALSAVVGGYAVAVAKPAD